MLRRMDDWDELVGMWGLGALVLLALALLVIR